MFGSMKSRWGSVLCVLIAVILGRAAAQTASGPSATQPRLGSLEWYAKRAHDEKKSSITVGPHSILYAELEPLDDALLHNTVVVATLLQSDTTHDDATIETWRKYKIDKKLTTQSISISANKDERFRAMLAQAPESLLPLQTGEFLAIDDGGTANIDGVTVTYPGEGTQTLTVGSKHLMFLLFVAGGKLGLQSYGPIGLFTIDDFGMLHARLKDLDSDRNALLNEIRQRTGGSITVFRALTQK